MRKYLKRRNNKKLKRWFKGGYVFYPYLKDLIANHENLVIKANMYGTYRRVLDIIPLVLICSQLDGEVLWYEIGNSNEI